MSRMMIKHAPKQRLSEEAQSLLLQLKAMPPATEQNQQGIALFKELSAALDRDWRFREAKAAALAQQAAKKRPRLECQQQHEAWEREKEAAKKKLLKYLHGKTTRRSLANNAAGLIHALACEYEATFRPVKKIRDAGDTLQSAPTAVDALKRLALSADSTPYQLSKAWLEMPTSAWKALINAGPGFGMPLLERAVPTRAILNRIPAAIAYASDPATETKAERNALLAGILFAYSEVTEKKPTISRSPNNKTLKFMRDIEAIYQELIGSGFEIPKSHSHLEKLVKRSLAATSRSFRKKKSPV